MAPGRLAAFTDGVLAVILTIMVLAIRLPESASLAALIHTTGPALLTYLLSFVYIGIYWNNHHHMLMLADSITGSTLWANLHLLFWLSLVPFSTAWIDDTTFAQTPVVIYGINLLCAALAYSILQATIIRGLGEASRLQRAIGQDAKGKISAALYLAGIGLGLLAGVTDGVSRWLALGCYVAVALIWLIPDVRLEQEIARAGPSSGEDS